MTRYLLDTSAYIAAAHGHPRLKEALRSADGVFVNPIMLGELQAGFLKGTQERKNRETLARFMALPRVTTVTTDEETAEMYAVIHDSLRKAGTPVPVNDIWIAASAMQHGLKVLTTDGHFKDIVQVIAEVHDREG